MSVRDIGVGVVSFGWMGRVHARAYRAIPDHFPGLEIRPRLVAVADTAPERIAEARSGLGFERGYTDFRDLLAEPEIEVVSVCAPNFLHAEIGAAVAAAGKHLWIEKPVGRNLGESAVVAAAVAAAGVVGTVGFNYRCAPAVEHMRAIVRAGKIGRVTNIRGAFFGDYSADPLGALSWRFTRDLAGTGVLGDLLAHLVDLVHYVVGPITAVSGATSIVHDRRPVPARDAATHFARGAADDPLGTVENEDYAALLARIDVGRGGLDNPGAGRDHTALGADASSRATAIATLEASRVAVGPRCGYGLEIYGTTGSVSWNFERMNELELAIAADGEEPGIAARGYRRILADPAMGAFAWFQPGAGNAMGYDDLKTVECAKFLAAIAEALDPGAGNGDEVRPRSGPNVPGGPRSTMTDAVRAAEVLEAGARAAAEERWVRIAEHRPETNGAPANAAT